MNTENQAWINRSRQVPTGKVMLRSWKKSVKLFALLSNIKKEKLQEDFQNIWRLIMISLKKINLSRPEMIWLTNQQSKSLIILEQVKCDYVTISGKFGVEKTYPRQYIQEFQELKTNYYATEEKVQNQIKISLELTRNQMKILWNYYSRQDKTQESYQDLHESPTSNQLHQWTC